MKNPGKKNFTLVEFLAVVAIIIIPLSLLLPRLKQSLDKVRGSPGKVVETGVLSPVVPKFIPNIKQASRLSSLNGKTVAVVGSSFMAHVTHLEIKRLIRRNYPTAKVIVLGEIGSAGPWPGPGVVRKQKDDFVRKLKELNVDAVIAGNGGSGLCTIREMGSCIAAEYNGIPAVMITAPRFADLAKRTAEISGVPIPRIAVYPGSFAAKNREELMENTKNLLWPQIADALMSPFAIEETEQAGHVPPPDSLVYSDNVDEVNAFFTYIGWSDGLPVIPPTPERVAAFLKYTDMAPDAVIGTIPPAGREATPRLVAVNGVMAGCKPEYMPILIAFTKAMTDGDFRRTLASTHAWTPYCWINGPLARQLELDCSQGEISAVRNAKIGRFINLAMLNLGGYYIKTNRMGTFGYLMPWCLAEDEAAAVKLHWRPYHMQQGFALNDNVLTAGSALSWGNNLAPATSNPQKIMEMMAWDAVEKEQFALGSGTPFVYRAILVTEYVARDLARKFKGKEELERALISAARRPVAERAYANYWGNPGSAFNPETYSMRRHIARIGRREGGKITLAPPWLAWTGMTKMETVPVMTAGKTAILVTGDASRNKTMCVPGGGFASVRIDLPKNWDALMKEAGYPPLRQYHLKSDLTPSDRPQQFKNYRRREQL